MLTWLFPMAVEDPTATESSGNGSSGPEELPSDDVNDPPSATDQPAATPVSQRAPSGNNPLRQAGNQSGSPLRGDGTKVDSTVDDELLPNATDKKTTDLSDEIRQLQEYLCELMARFQVLQEGQERKRFRIAMMLAGCSALAYGTRNIHEQNTIMHESITKISSKLISYRPDMIDKESELWQRLNKDRNKDIGPLAMLFYVVFMGIDAIYYSVGYILSFIAAHFALVISVFLIVYVVGGHFVVPCLQRHWHANRQRIELRIHRIQERTTGRVINELRQHRQQNTSKRDHRRLSTIPRSRTRTPGASGRSSRMPGSRGRRLQDSAISEIGSHSHSAIQPRNLEGNAHFNELSPVIDEYSVYDRGGLHNRRSDEDLFQQSGQSLPISSYDSHGLSSPGLSPPATNNGIALSSPGDAMPSPRILGPTGISPTGSRRRRFESNENIFGESNPDLFVRAGSGDDDYTGSSGDHTGSVGSYTGSSGECTESKTSSKESAQPQNRDVFTSKGGTVEFRPSQAQAQPDGQAISEPRISGQPSPPRSSGQPSKSSSVQISGSPPSSEHSPPLDLRPSSQAAQESNNLACNSQSPVQRALRELQLTPEEQALRDFTARQNALAQNISQSMMSNSPSRQIHSFTEDDGI